MSNEKKNEVYGFDGFTDKLNRIKRELPHELDRWLMKQAQELEDRAAFDTPVDTDYLRQMWSKTDVEHEGNRVFIEVFNSAEYALHIEYGHRIFSLYNDYGANDIVPGVYMLTGNLKKLERSMPERVKKLWEELGFE